MIGSSVDEIGVLVGGAHAAQVRDRVKGEADSGRKRFGLLGLDVSGMEIRGVAKLVL